MTVFFAKKQGDFEQYSTFEEAYATFQPSGFGAVHENPFTITMKQADDFEKTVVVIGPNMTNRFRIYTGGFLAKNIQSPTLFKHYLESNSFYKQVKSKKREIIQISVTWDLYSGYTCCSLDLWYGKWREDMRWTPEIHYDFNRRDRRQTKPKLKPQFHLIDWEKEGF